MDGSTLWIRPGLPSLPARPAGAQHPRDAEPKGRRRRGPAAPGHGSVARRVARKGCSPKGSMYGHLGVDRIYVNIE